jgi:hypothetical protein
VTVAVSVPLVVGVNEIVFVQLAPAGSGFGQVDAVFANELAFAPVTVVVAVKLTAAVPVFFTVISCVAVVPTGVEANATGGRSAESDALRRVARIIHGLQGSGQAA